MEELVKKYEIRDAKERYARALAKHYDAKDLYGSLCKAAEHECDTLLEERDCLNRQIDRTKDPLERKALEHCRDIEMAEYMLITSLRLAKQADILDGKNSERAKSDREKATTYAAKAEKLRKELREIYYDMADNDAVHTYPRNEREALALFGLDSSADFTSVRTRYLHLVKKFHPDVNDGNLQAEEKLKNINHAYVTLRALYETG